MIAPVSKAMEVSVSWRSRTALLLIALLAAQPAPAAGQRAGSVVIDDPSGALGDDRSAVRDAGRKLVRRSAFRTRLIVSVVPSLGDRAPRKVTAQRFSELAPRGPFSDVVLLLALDERIAIFGVRDPDELKGELAEGAVQFTEPLEVASDAATESFGSGDPGSAVLAGIAEVADQDGVGEAGSSDVRAQDWLVWLIPVLLGFGLFNLVRGVRARRRLRVFAGGVTAVRNLEEGTAMVSGTAVTSEPLLSPVTGRPCVHWELSVKEEWVSTTIERGTYEEVSPTWRGSGVPPPNLVRHVPYEREVETGTGTKDHGTTRYRVPFHLRDGTGEVLIDPDRAEVTAKTTFEDTVDRSNPAYHAPDIRERHASTVVRHLREALVPVNELVTVMGPVELEDGSPRIRWARRRGPSARSPFLITVEEPVRAERAERHRMIRGFAVATACLAGIIVILALTAG